MFLPVIVILILMLLTNLAWWRWAHRHLSKLRRRRIFQWVLACFMLLQILGLTLTFLTRARLSVLPVPAIWMAAIYLWHMIFLPPILVGLILFVFAKAVGWIASWCRGDARPPTAASPANGDGHPMLTRRQVMGATLAALPPLFATSAVVRAVSQLDDFRVRRITIALAALPKALDGMTIAQVSDVHVGKFTNGSILRRITETTNALRPDLVLLTGDLIDFSQRDLPAGLDVVRRFDPRAGLAMCEGNHDLFEGREAFDQQVRAAGVPLLIDETMSTRVRGTPVQLLGLQWGPRRGGGEAVIESSMDRLNALRDPEAFQILLAHHPHAFDRAAREHIPLTLAGHTHGGQLMLSEITGFGPAMYRYWSGLYRQNDSALVVSNGVGNWFPLRLNAPAEIVHITLRVG